MNLDFVLRGTALFLLLSVSVFSQCVFPDSPPGSQPPGYERLTNIIGKVFTNRHELTESTTYAYNVGICVKADKDQTPPQYEYAGALQYSIKDKKANPPPTIVGRINNTELISGVDWIMLTYNGGEQYNTHCGSEERQAVIMIFCDENAHTDKLRVVQEVKDKLRNCFYLFEIDHADVCPVAPVAASAGLSTGSILLIIFFSVIAAYLLLGFLYQRIVTGARGMEQFPNISFWRDFGALQADGCDLICRCGLRSSTPQSYRGIGENQLESDHHDDRLLPM